MTEPMAADRPVRARTKARKFLKYLDDRILAKEAERDRYKSTYHARDLLKTEIAELRVVRHAFAQAFELP